MRTKISVLIALALLGVYKFYPRMDYNRTRIPFTYYSERLDIRQAKPFPGIPGNGNFVWSVYNDDYLSIYTDEDYKMDLLLSSEGNHSIYYQIIVSNNGVPNYFYKWGGGEWEENPIIRRSPLHRIIWFSAKDIDVDQTKGIRVNIPWSSMPLLKGEILINIKLGPNQRPLTDNPKTNAHDRNHWFVLERSR